MHIVVLNHYAGSPAMGMEYRPYYLGQEWLKKGHKVTIVAATYSHLRTHNKDFKEKITRETIDGIEYIWIKTCHYKGNSWGRIRSIFEYLWGLYSLIPVLVKEKPDAVIASSTYPLDNYPAYKLAKKSGAKYLYEVHDLWPLSPMELGGYSKWHPFIMVMQWAEDFAYKHVDKVISIMPNSLEHMSSRGLNRSKFFHIPNGIVLDEVQSPIPLPADVEAQLPKDKFIVGYCGTFGIANALFNVLNAAALIKDKNPDICYCLVGKGPERENLQKYIRDRQLNNVIIIDSIPKKSVQTMLSRFGIAILSLNDSPLFRFGISPNKLFDYMYSGKPVVQSVIAGNDIPGDSGCGITCKPDPEEIVKAIMQIYNMDKEQRAAMGVKGREYVLKNHTYSVLAEKFIEAIQKNVTAL